MGMRKSTQSRLAAVAVLALTVSACAAGSSGETSTTAPTATTATTTPLAEETTSTVKPPPKAPNIDLTAIPDWFQDEDAAPDTLVAAIAERLNATYVGSMAIEWPTGGLGCGGGGAELQVITPGYVIFYQDTDTLIRVHTAESGNWKECPLGRPLEGVPTLTS